MTKSFKRSSERGKEQAMDAEKKGNESVVPRVGGKKKAEKPNMPKPPSAPTEENIKDKEAMPDLDQFNFMNW